MGIVKEDLLNVVELGKSLTIRKIRPLPQSKS